MCSTTTHFLSRVTNLLNIKCKRTMIECDLTVFVRKVLITDDFPTFGYPTNPTDIACLSLFRRANCLKTDNRDP